MPVIGVLGSGSRDAMQSARLAFLQGLSEIGYVDGRNVTIEYRWADGQYERLRAMAAEFVQRRVGVIVTFSGTPTADAAKAATPTIPIVFILGSDPVAAGLVRSLNRPGGNLTGVTNLTIGLAQKRLELLHNLVPKLSIIGFLINPANSTSKTLIKEYETAARQLGMQSHFLTAKVDGDFQPAFDSLVRNEPKDSWLGATHSIQLDVI